MALVFPGQPLGPSSEYTPGPGTHLYDGQVCASTLGLARKTTTQGGTTSASHPTLTVTIPTPSTSTGTSTDATSSRAKTTLPAVNSTVLARVTRITPRQATLSIQVVDGHVALEPFQGLVRAQDVRATEKDRVRIADSFRPGDVVRAVVISIGDQANYYLSTASNELGVVVARSELGNAMYPVSWREFRDPVVGGTEARKVAKPF